jgi:hypothetical protein
MVRQAKLIVKVGLHEASMFPRNPWKNETREKGAETQHLKADKNPHWENGNRIQNLQVVNNLPQAATLAAADPLPRMCFTKKSTVRWGGKGTDVKARRQPKKVRRTPTHMGRAQRNQPVRAPLLTCPS